VLADRGVRFVAPAATPRQPTDVQVSGGVRARVRALRHMRTELAQNSVCVLLPARGLGRVTRVPFFRRQLHIGAGAFHLAAVAAAPLLAFFVVSSPRPPRFRLEFSSLASGTGQPRDIIAEFTGFYADYVRRYPSHLPYGPSAGLFVERGENPDAES
jgi:lauroyl/myristoyl acyltransferase